MMAKWILVFLVATFGGVGMVAASTARGELENGFASPPVSARPWVYWFWLDGNITREGITADLEAMNRVGIGGVIIMEVNEGTPKGPNRFFSGPWRELFKITLAEAKRLGMEVNMTNSAGWTGSGGPWITPELAMQKLVWSEAEVEAGSEPVEVTLAKPEATAGFYRDVAVLAVPKVEQRKSVKELSPRITTGPGEAKGDLRKLIDGDLKKGVDLPRPGKNGGGQWVQFEFSEPFTARSMHAALGWARDRKCQGEVQVSEDGKEFKTVAKFEGQVPGVTVSFPKATGRVFRVMFTSLDARVNILRVGELELSERVQLGELEGKTALTTERNISDGPWPTMEAGQAVERKSVVDLTNQMKADGTLRWNPPASGKWTILRIGYTPTGKDNHPAPDEGHGLESDKLSREATDVHFDALMGKLIADAGDLAGSALTATHIDSWEVGSQNWTPRFREEFTKRRGYDPLPFLPVVTGQIIDSVEVSERFLWDWRQTISDLIAENYFGRMRELAHEHGMRFTLEPYHGPFDEITCGGRCDEAMSTFWTTARAIDFTNLQTASEAHVYGQKIVGAEAFTANNTEKWQQHPCVIKALGDWAFCQGINRFVVHRYAMQPWMNVAPGMSMGPWGLHYERTQTWWEQSKPWHEYLARCQYLLRQGMFVADVVYLEPEGSPTRFSPPAQEECAYAGDACSPEVVMTRMSVKDGRIVLPDGMSYRALVLPKVHAMTPGLLRKIKSLVDEGAVVIASDSTPLAASPGLTNYPSCDDEVRALSAELWDKGRVHIGTVEKVFADMKVPVDFAYTTESGEKCLRYTHRSDKGMEIYFLSNQSDRPQRAMCTFRASGRPEFWRADSGKMEKVAWYDVVDGRVSLAVNLDASGSVFVVIKDEAAEPDRVVSVERDGKEAMDVSLTREAITTEHGGRLELKTADGKSKRIDIGQIPPAVSIEGSWEVQFPPGWGAPEHVTLDHLQSWGRHENVGVRFFSGAGTYRKTISISKDQLATDRRLILNLGDVQVMADVTVNGKALGVLWKKPYRVDATDALKEGDNALEIKVTNLWINRMIGDEQLPEDSSRNPNGTLVEWPAWVLKGQKSPTGRFTFTSWRLYQKDSPLVDSGLLGPVMLQSVARVKLPD